MGKQEDEGTSHLYRLILKSDNTVKVDIDQEEIYSGNLKDDWEVLKPKKISDPDDKKPDDWVDEAMKDNPEFKGEWMVKRISNPEYKGVWTAKDIDNPEYEDDDNVYLFEDTGFIGFDLWQVKGGTIFDNIMITDDVAEADEMAKKWKTLSDVEKAKKKEEDEAKKADDKKAEDEKEDDDDDDADTGGDGAEDM